MITLITSVIIMIIAGTAGILGALLGIGGGIIIIPLLIFLGYSIQEAAAASIIAVIGTSSAAAATYVKEEFTNIRLGMFLEVATTIGAVIGALTAFLVPKETLLFVLGLVLFYVSIQMLVFKPRSSLAANNDRLSQKLQLSGSFHDMASGKDITYSVDRPLTIFGISGIAGILSGLLGIGGGIIKVPAMNLIGKMPMKAATATSNFMIGVTAATTAFLYFNQGLVNLEITAPIVLGIVIGATFGTRLAKKANANTVKRTFAIFTIFMGTKFICEALGIHIIIIMIHVI